MPRPSLTIEQVVSLLDEMPRRIAALTADVPTARLRVAPARGEWSVKQALAHLRSCADARGEFIPKILASDRPTLRAVDPNTLIKTADYREQEFASSFRAFTRQRARLLKLLRSLLREEWVRTALVTGGGSVRERTVLFYAQWLARHERAHVRQIARIVERVSRTR